MRVFAGPVAAAVVALCASDVRTQSVENVPHTPGAVAALLHQVFSTERRPFGFEAVNERENRALWNSERVDTGTHVRAFMEAYARNDRRFKVEDVGGLPVMRPVNAWLDPFNPLHRRLTASITVTDVGWREALDRLCTAAGAKVRHSSENPGHFFLDPDELQAHDEVQDRHVSLAVGQTTVLEALNTLAQSHGELAWTVLYARQGPLVLFSTRFHDGFGCYLPPPPLS